MGRFTTDFLTDLILFIEIMNFSPFLARDREKRGGCDYILFRGGGVEGHACNIAVNLLSNFDSGSG